MGKASTCDRSSLPQVDAGISVKTDDGLTVPVGWVVGRSAQSAQAMSQVPSLLSLEVASGEIVAWCSLERRF